MKSPVLFAALLLQVSSVMAGAWVIQPPAEWRYSYAP
ncbi:Uncharacterised protein [Hafnia alvei]|uniref:Uncharacterized protein n=1 Tax=Hafnia alvei TaxID=569 RepID=A0A377PI54_HAFAL|nr:Uncharacterised protein [Hafnia alvei]